MPSKTPKQAKFMQAVAHSPKFARQSGVPQTVGKDFVEADRQALGRVLRSTTNLPKSKLSSPGDM
jgi:hypothetical protein